MDLYTNLIAVGLGAVLASFGFLLKRFFTQTDKVGDKTNCNVTAVRLIEKDIDDIKSKYSLLEMINKDVIIIKSDIKNMREKYDEIYRTSNKNYELLYMLQLSNNELTLKLENLINRDD